MTTRDVTLHQADGVAFHPTNGDLASAHWDDGGLTVVILYDELVQMSHAGLRER